MTNKAKPIFTLRVGAEVYLLGTKPWVIKACNFKTGKLTVDFLTIYCRINNSEAF